MKAALTWLDRCSTALVAAYFAFGIGFGVMAVAGTVDEPGIVLLPWVTPLDDEAAAAPVQGRTK